MVFQKFWKNSYFLFTGIIILGAILRLYQLSSFPVGFHIDEAIIGDTAYSLLLTGKDYDGRNWPLNIEVFNDYVPAGYHYLTILPVKILGLTIFATRFPGAVIGFLMSIPMYFLALILFKKKSLSLLSAFLSMLSPWAIVFSRATSEAFVALCFVLMGFVFLLYALEKKKILFLCLSTFFFALSFFFYHTPRVFAPMLFFTTVVTYFFSWKTKQLFLLWKYLVSFLFLCILSFLLVFMLGGGTNRFSQTSIFTNPGTRLVMQEQIREDGVLGTPAKITRIFHNKVVNYSLTFISNYLSYFDGNMLFISGGKPIILLIPSMGVLYLIELPFILIGIISLSTSKNKLLYLPLIWMLLSPIVAALTLDDSPNIRRAIELFPILDLIAAYGFFVVIEKIKGVWKIGFIAVVTLFFLFNAGYFFHQYFVHAKIHQPWNRNNGFEEMTTTVNELAPRFDKIVVTTSKGTIWPLLVFYSKYDPKTYQEEGSVKNTPYKSFGKYFFAPYACPSLIQDPKFPKGKLLFVEHGEVCKKQISGKTYQFIYREDGTKAFRIAY